MQFKVSQLEFYIERCSFSNKQNQHSFGEIFHLALKLLKFMIRNFLMVFSIVFQGFECIQEISTENQFKFNGKFQMKYSHIFPRKQKLN